MDYQRLHDSIIDRAKGRTLDAYTETHHILPRCLGGTDDPNNLVSLTAKEHFLVHKLLVEIYPEEKSLKFALWMMSNCKKENRSYRIGSREYERLRKDHSELISEVQKGNTNTRGYKHSEETKKNMSKAMEGNKRALGYKHTDEARLNMSISRTGRKYEIVACPHCNKEGGITGMKRWHFDNCKQNAVL